MTVEGEKIWAAVRSCRGVYKHLITQTRPGMRDEAVTSNDCYSVCVLFDWVMVN